MIEKSLNNLKLI